MGVSISIVRARVRERLNDMNDGPGAIGALTVDSAIAESFVALSAWLPAPLLYIANALTIAAGSETFSLPVTVAGTGYTAGNTEYRGEVKLQRTSDNLYMVKITNEQMDAKRSGYTVTPLARPEVFALYEDASQVVQGRCWPAPKVAEACNMWATLNPEDLINYVGASNDKGLDDVTVPLSRAAEVALVAYTAGELLSRMPDDVADGRGLNKSKASDWNREAFDLLYQDEARRHSIRQTGRYQRWTR